MTNPSMPADKVQAILAARHRKDQMEGDGAVGCFDAAAAVEELRDAGLLAPALPDGWRTAEHPLHGPGIITTPTPLDSGRIHFITPAPNLLGYRWHLCNPAELTYPDTPDGPQRRRNLPPHRTEAGHPNCATCDGGGCPDCTDPA